MCKIHTFKIKNMYVRRVFDKISKTTGWKDLYFLGLFCFDTN